MRNFERERPATLVGRLIDNLKFLMLSEREKDLPALNFHRRILNTRDTLQLGACQETAVHISIHGVHYN